MPNSFGGQVSLVTFVMYATSATAHIKVMNICLLTRKDRQEVAFVDLYHNLTSVSQQLVDLLFTRLREAQEVADWLTQQMENEATLQGTLRESTEILYRRVADLEPHTDDQLERSSRLIADWLKRQMSDAETIMTNFSQAWLDRFSGQGTVSSGR